MESTVFASDHCIFVLRCMWKMVSVVSSKLFSIRMTAPFKKKVALMPLNFQYDITWTKQCVIFGK